MMLREPDTIPLKPGIFALANRKRRFVYISYTGNLQKRSHSASHMLMAYDKDANAYWPIKHLPKHTSDEFVFMVMNSKGVTPANALAHIATIQKQFMAKGYKIIEGQRAGSPTVTLEGKRVSLAAAVRDHSKDKYLTVYRRLERGWTVKQALGIDPPAPRWHKGKQEERRARAEA